MLNNREHLRGGLRAGVLYLSISIGYTGLRRALGFAERRGGGPAAPSAALQAPLPCQGSGYSEEHGAAYAVCPPHGGKYRSVTYGNQKLLRDAQLPKPARKCRSGMALSISVPAVWQAIALPCSLKGTDRRAKVKRLRRFTEQYYQGRKCSGCRTLFFLMPSAGLDKAGCAD